VLVPVGPLPDDPLQAAARFHGEVLPGLLAHLEQAGDHLTLVFDPASFPHEDWRRAAIATLARERTPVRINAIAGDDPAALAATAHYIAHAPGLTGQYLIVAPD
jgi:hypothetical protein